MIMNKKILFFISFLFLSSAMFAQSMSDDQVIKFIKTEQAKGTNQQTIVTKLMRRGVTTQQLQRVRKKYQQQQQQMGAVDAVDRVKDDDRMRLDVEKGSFGSENNRSNDCFRHPIIIIIADRAGKCNREKRGGR